MRISRLLPLAALLGACTVGPDYQGPPDAAPTARQAAAFHRAAVAPADPTPPAAAWWEALNDGELNKLVARALDASPNIQAAEARLRQARAGLKQQRAAELPSFAGNALYLHTNMPDLGGLTGGSSGSGGGSQGLDLYAVGFDATWEVDIFGGTRRAIEAANAKAEASQADLEDLHVSLAAEVAQAYIGLRDEQQRLELAKRSTALEEQMLALTEQRRARGAASEADVERLRTQLESTRGTAIPLQAQIEASLDQLAVLTGQEPGSLDGELATPAALPDVPARVAVGDPAAFLRRRPDIRRAERNLAASNAQIGQQVANYFPKVNLLGNVGWGATDPGQLFNNFTPVVAPILQWNLLDFGKTAAKVDQAEAGRDEAAANYRAAVLAALQDAEGALSRYGRQRDSVVNLERIQASAERSLILTRQRHDRGAASLIELLDAERTRLSAEQDLTAGRGQMVTDFAALQKSLGLGWNPPQTETSQR